MGIFPTEFLKGAFFAGIRMFCKKDLQYKKRTVTGKRGWNILEIGKIPPKVLERIVLNPIRDFSVKRSDVMIRPKTGEDCSAIDLGGELCVLSTDPITGAEKDMGYIAVHINCNDAASSGAEPIGILLTVLLPPYSTEDMLSEIMDGVYRAAMELGIEVLGGHTEVTAVVNKPVISATVIAKTLNRNFISTGGAKAGQDVIMTKWAGLEGTAIIAKDYEESLRGLLSDEMIQKAQHMSGFLSVVKEAKIAIAHGATAMHDATEGGILGAAWEMADCSELGIDLYLDKIPVKNETKLICQAAGINPYGLISSGTLMIAAFEGELLVKELEKAGIEGAVIGKITKNEKRICENGKYIPLQQPQSDEIYRVMINKVQ